MPSTTDVVPGPTEAVVRALSANSAEPAWMTNIRLKGLRLFEYMPLPDWGADLSGIEFGGIEFGGIEYDARPAGGRDAASGESPGMAARYREATAYDEIRADLRRSGVVFVDTETGLTEHPEIFRRYFGSVVPPGDNKFVALNTAVWSGGSFVYVPPGVHVEIPLQALGKIDSGWTGVFERTLIVVDEGADVHYIEGYAAPSTAAAAAATAATGALHAPVVEVVVKKDARCRYTSMHWSRNAYNLVTKRAICHTGATMEWVDAGLGSKVTMKYPVVWLLGEHARGEAFSIDFAWAGQHQDVGATMVHAAEHTSSKMMSKSVVCGGGRVTYRGLVQVDDGAHSTKSTMIADALQVDAASRWETLPNLDVRERDAAVGHASAVSCVGADQLYYLMSRGMSGDAATAMVIRGFIEAVSRELPMEYALEVGHVILAELQAGNVTD